MNDKLPIVLHQGMVRKLFIGGTQKHQFGGESNLRIIGLPEGEPPLHQILSLNLTDKQLGFSIQGISRLVLLYGLVYSGCELKYQMISDDEIHILEMNPKKPYPNWPYTNCPTYFQPVSLAVGSPEPVGQEDIEEITWWQFDESKPNDVWINVPEYAGFGVSIWGPAAEGEGVEIVFQVDLETKTVYVRNECS
jgi:hypothetical protein